MCAEPRQRQTGAKRFSHLCKGLHTQYSNIQGLVQLQFIKMPNTTIKNLIPQNLEILKEEINSMTNVLT